MSESRGPTVQQFLARGQEEWRARYLRDVSLTVLADWIGALAAELCARGVQVAEPMGRVQARIQAHIGTEPAR